MFKHALQFLKKSVFTVAVNMQTFFNVKVVWWRSLWLFHFKCNGKLFHSSSVTFDRISYSHWFKLYWNIGFDGVICINEFAIWEPKCINSYSFPIDECFHCSANVLKHIWKVCPMWSVILLLCFLNFVAAGSMKLLCWR